MQPDTTLLAVTLGLAVLVAARSTWSPCGLSMLSMITPLGEASRGNRYATTVLWFVLGAVLGGATLGAGAAVLALGVGLLAPSVEVVAAAGAVLALVAVAHDVRLGGFALPAHRRQVDEVWLTGFRPWVYGVGFGWQIGVGLATYIVTAGVYLVVALAVLLGSPAAALAIGVTFAAVRGLAVLLGVGLVSPSALRTFHRRFEAAGPASARVTTAGLVLTAVVLLAVALPPVAPIALVAVAVVMTVLRARAVSIESSRSPARRSTVGAPGSPTV